MPTIVIAGGTGFLGAPLAAALSHDGHDVVVLSRRADRHLPSATPGSPASSSAGRAVKWTPDGTAEGPWSELLNGAAAVINLAGESIAGKRWSVPQKDRILNSRLLATRSLVSAIAHASSPPAVFVSGSAVGYYGPLGDEVVTESHAAGRDFLAEVCTQWEAAAMMAASVTRVVCVRTGIVLERNGGALSKMLPPFRFGAGGPVGSGTQYWPWIHRRDWIDLVRFAIGRPSLSGPLNASAPHPITNAEFARVLGRVLHRPAFFPAPAFALRLMLGEMADALLLSGQRAIPAKAEQAGYSFAYPRAEDALTAIFT